MLRSISAAAGAVCLLVLAACSNPPQTVAAPSDLVMQTASGSVEGVKLASGVRGWFGVPFAAPPVGDLRWKAPQPAAAWQGVKHADRFAPDCIQTLRNEDTNHWYGAQTISEDCLYLNVWAPATPPAAGEKLPVIVWIYGGGFNIGSANTPLYGGEQLAKKGAVYVAIAYRVGALGFMAHPELTAEGGGSSGNFGLRDQVAGLQWVKDNIAAFGGDPGNVTIMGQSAGSASVAYLQQSPLAKGLINQVVGMSGAPFGGRTLSPNSLSDAEAIGTRIQTALGAKSLAEMRNAAPDRFLSIQQGAGPILDGKVLTASSAETFAAKQQSDVPIMIGYTADEGFSPIGAAKTVQAFKTAVQQTYQANADKILAAYPAGSDAEAAKSSHDLARDSTLALQMNGWARAQVASGKSPAYAFFFSRVHPYREGVTFSDHDPATVGAYHTSDVPYWLQTLEALNAQRPTRNWTDEDRAVAVRMSDAILNFAKTGNPNPAGASEWPAYDPNAEKVMEFGKAVAVIDWPNAAKLQVLRDLPATPQSPPPASSASAPRGRD